MSVKIGLILLLVASEGLGLLFGEWASRISRQTVPQISQTSFNQNAAHVAFLGTGAVMGLGVFVFSLIAVFLARFFGRKPQTTTVVVTPPQR